MVPCAGFSSSNALAAPALATAALAAAPAPAPATLGTAPLPPLCFWDLGTALDEGSTRETVFGASRPAPPPCFLFPCHHRNEATIRVERWLCARQDRPRGQDPSSPAHHHVKLQRRFRRAQKHHPPAPDACCSRSMRLGRPGAPCRFRAAGSIPFHSSSHRSSRALNRAGRVCGLPRDSVRLPCLQARSGHSWRCAGLRRRGGPGSGRHQARGRDFHGNRAQGTGGRQSLFLTACRVLGPCCVAVGCSWQLWQRRTHRVHSDFTQASLRSCYCSFYYCLLAHYEVSSSSKTVAWRHDSVGLHCHRACRCGTCA